MYIYVCVYIYTVHKRLCDIWKQYLYVQKNTKRSRSKIKYAKLTRASEMSRSKVNQLVPFIFPNGKINVNDAN